MEFDASSEGIERACSAARAFAGADREIAQDLPDYEAGIFQAVLRALREPEPSAEAGSSSKTEDIITGPVLLVILAVLIPEPPLP